MNVSDLVLVVTLFVVVGMTAHWLCQYGFSGTRGIENKGIGWSVPLLLESRKGQEDTGASVSPPLLHEKRLAPAGERYQTPDSVLAGLARGDESASGQDLRRGAG